MNKVRMCAWHLISFSVDGVFISSSFLRVSFLFLLSGDFYFVASTF